MNRFIYHGGVNSCLFGFISTKKWQKITIVFIYRNHTSLVYYKQDIMLSSDEVCELHLMKPPADRRVALWIAAKAATQLARNRRDDSDRNLVCGVYYGQEMCWIN